MSDLEVIPFGYYGLMFKSFKKHGAKIGISGELAKKRGGKVGRGGQKGREGTPEEAVACFHGMLTRAWICPDARLIVADAYV